MEYSVISSRNNDKIKYVRKLISDSSARRSAQLFVLEGARLCSDAVRSGYEIEEAYVSDGALEKYSDIISGVLDAARRVYRITDEVADKLSDTVNTQGVFCVARMNGQTALHVEKGGRYVALENIQNPQNLGTVARTAEALGIDALIVYEGCDIYNPKALRASMGSLMRIPVYQVSDLAAVIDNARECGIPTLATVPDADAEDITAIDFSQGALSVIGNEGNGISREIRSHCAVCVTIRMKGAAESLNASAAATIAMWEMVR